MKSFRFSSFLIAVMLIGVAACDNASRDVRKMWDSGPVEEIVHSGNFLGYASVYTIDWLNNEASRSDKAYRVYKRRNGSYIMDYQGKNYILQEANPPFGEGLFSLKWKLDYNHYIESIPTSY